jgi:hypothetical protein
MSGLDREAELLGSLSREMNRNVLAANVLARRLDSIIREMGEGISETLYRRARDMVQRGNEHLITEDSNNSRIIRELLRQESPIGGSAPRFRDIGIPEDPRDLHALWSGLSRSDREALFREDPFLGNRDGIPQADRDVYNRRNLENLRQGALLEYGRDRKRAAFYDAMHSMLGERGGPMYLSYLDENGNFAFSRGNPDFADNAVVLLNPVNEGEPFRYADETLGQIGRAARLVDPNAHTSVTLWGASGSPHSVLEAIFPHSAADGAPLVRKYHEGLRVTHEGTPSHTTTIGHSYSGVLAGHAAGHGAGLNTDELVFVGSWGTGANHVGELNLSGVAPERTAEHVFATMAPRDSIQLMPDTHGPMPTDPAFGATIFSSGSSPSDLRWNPDDHFATNYLNSSNPAYTNIGLIVTGRGDLVA